MVNFSANGILSAKRSGNHRQAHSMRLLNPIEQN